MATNTSAIRSQSVVIGCATLVEGRLHGRAAVVEALAGLCAGFGWQRTDLAPGAEQR
jgi:hypothetical protein